MADTWITLTMSLDASRLEVLPADAPGFYTDIMADCVSVVVLWNYNRASGRYLNGHGLHCWGGIADAHWEGLLKDVPADAVRIVAVGGNVGIGGNNDKTRFEDELKERGYGQVQHSIEQATFALIHRDGTVEASKKPPENVKATPGCCLIQ